MSASESDPDIQEGIVDDFDSDDDDTQNSTIADREPTIVDTNEKSEIEKFVNEISKSESKDALLAAMSLLPKTTQTYGLKGRNMSC